MPAPMVSRSRWTGLAEADDEPSLRTEAPVAALVPLVGFLVFLGLSVVLDMARHHVPWPVSFAPFVVALIVCCAVATPLVALLLTACAWLNYDGFVAGHEGTLHWQGTADAIRICVLIGCALLTMLIRSSLRASRIPTGDV
jgi:hypothetical protein